MLLTLGTDNLVRLGAINVRAAGCQHGLQFYDSLLLEYSFGLHKIVYSLTAIHIVFSLTVMMR